MTLVHIPARTSSTVLSHRRLAPTPAGCCPAQESSGDATRNTGTTIGSPAEVVEEILSFHDHLGPYQRQLFGMSQRELHGKTVHEIVDLVGAEVLRILRRGTAAPGPATAAPLRS